MKYLCWITLFFFRFKREEVYRIVIIIQQFQVSRLLHLLKNIKNDQENR